MAGSSDWKVPPGVQPKPQDYPYDLERALSAVVGVSATVPPDAFTAQTLGTERAGSGVQIQDGIVADHRLPRHRGAVGLAHHRRRPRRPGPRPRLRPGDGLRPRAGARPARPADAGARRFEGRRPWRARRRRGLRRAGPLGRGPDRREAGIRRLLGVCPRRGDLHRPGPSALGRHGGDRTGRRPHRHRLAAAPACGRGRPARPPQHGRADRPPQADPRRIC